MSSRDSAIAAQQPRPSVPPPHPSEMPPGLGAPPLPRPGALSGKKSFPISKLNLPWRGLPFQGKTTRSRTPWKSLSEHSSPPKSKLVFPLCLKYVKLTRIFLGTRVNLGPDYRLLRRGWEAHLFTNVDLLFPVADAQTAISQPNPGNISVGESVSL